MSIHKFPSHAVVDQGGGGGDNTDMEARVSKLEVLIQSMSTKEDLLRLEVKLHQELNAQTWKFVTWMTGICTALIAATYFIARSIH